MVRDKILETFPELTPHDVRSTSMGVSGVDILLSRVALDAFPYAVECKNRNRIAVYDMYAQSKHNGAKTGYTPLLVIKQNHSEPLVVLSLEDFMQLVGGKSTGN
jgi:hypothetical protein